MFTHNDNWGFYFHWDLYCKTQGKKNPKQLNSTANNGSMQTHSAYSDRQRTFTAAGVLEKAEILNTLTR